MGPDVPVEPLGSLVDSDRGISYGIVQPGQEVASGVPIVRVTDVRDGRISTSAPLKVHPEIEAKFQRTRLCGGELLLTLVGTVGETAVVPSTLCGWNTARAVGVIPVRDDIGARWVRYALQAPAAKEFMRVRLNTTVQATLNLGDVAAIPIPLPGKRTRSLILSILGTLDDKIELNRRTNETLEAMARALFKSWFVDFDPVHAKAAGQAPAGMDAETAALFPSEFVASEIGEIPKEWRCGVLEDLQAEGAHAITAGPFGSKLVSSDYTPAGVPVIRGSNLGGQPGLWFSDEEFVFVSDAKADRDLKSCLARRGDVLFTQRGTLGQVGMVPHDADYDRFVVSQSQMKMTCAGDVPPEYVVLMFKQQATIDFIRANAVAAGVPHINLGFLRRFPVLIPPPAILVAFGKINRPVTQRMRGHIRESRALAVLRDALLPRLLSGELAIPNAERIVGDRT